MAVPSSVRFTKDGVEYLNNVDQAKYYIEELTRAALKETGKYICKETKKKIKKRTGRLAKNTQYWVRKKSGDLQVGFKPGGFYGIYQELGTEKTPRIGALRGSVEDNIQTIQRIQAQYLSALSELNPGPVDESEDMGDE